MKKYLLNTFLAGIFAAVLLAMVIARALCPILVLPGFDVPNLVLPPEHRMHQRAAGVALAAQVMMDAGEPGNGAELTPNYLRLSQAERERAARENK